MPSVLTYVDELLARQIATGLIGSEVQLSKRSGSTVGINFKVLLQRNQGVETATTTRISDLLPELVAEALNEAIRERVNDLGIARSRLVAGSPGAYAPGTPVVVSNARLSIREKEPKSVLAGEDCVRYRLIVNEYFVHAFGPHNAETLLDGMADQPIDVAGILRYTPAYPVPGAVSLNLGLRICAIWLR